MWGTGLRGRPSCAVFMKISIKTQNTKMTFDLRQEDAESLIWSAFQYASGNQPYQEVPDPEEGGYPEDAGDPDSAEGLDGEEEAEGQQPEPDGWAQPDSAGGEPDGGAGPLVPDGLPPGMGQEGQEPGISAPWVMQEPGHQRYKGFLFIKCRACGKMKGFCAKKPIDTYTCICGEKTPVQDLVPMVAACKCRKIWTYRTNADDQAIEMECIACGNPIDLVWNARRGKYVSIED